MADKPAGLIDTAIKAMGSSEPTRWADNAQGAYVDPRQPPKIYPGAEELKLGREVDQFYGNPKAAWFEPGADIRTIDIANAPEIINDKRFDNVKWDKIDQDRADRLYVAAVAANKSPLAALGFDPRAFIASPPSEEDLPVAGVYDKKNDFIWVDENYPSTYVHESVHRGMEQLRQAGLVTRSVDEALTPGNKKVLVGQATEELMTRAIMLRHFGNVERDDPYASHPQIDRAERMYVKDTHGSAFVDQIESLAAKLIQQRTPRGPR